MTETEVARIERDGQAGLAELGLQLAEAKQLTAALQAQIVPAQVAVMGERRCWCGVCERVLASKGHYLATFRSLRRSAPCSATCRSGSDGCSSAPVKVRVRRRASPPWTSARARSHQSWPT